MRRSHLAALCLAVLPSLAGRCQEITNLHTTVRAAGEPGRWTGFLVATADGRPVATVQLGGLGNLTASSVDVRDGRLVLGGLTAQVGVTLEPASTVTIALAGEDPYPVVSFDLRLTSFDRAAWESAYGPAPFYFLSCAQPGAEIFHQRGWSIMTPALDPYSLHNEGTGYGRQIAAEWSKDWTYAPPVGAWPLATVGLWTPRAQRYVAYDFHDARLGDHSERDIAAAYCWRQAGAGPLLGRTDEQFFALVWPYARPYRVQVRYPEPPVRVASHFALLYRLDLPADDDPTYFVHRYVWERYADRLPAVTPIGELSWLSAEHKPTTFRPPGAPGGFVHRITPEEAQWWEPGTLVYDGLGHDGDPIAWLYETGRRAEIGRLKEQLDQVLGYARRETIAGQQCVVWQQPLEGEGNLKLFGAGVGTPRNRSAWAFGKALLCFYRQEPEAERRLLPYLDGLLRFTKVQLTTRNDIPDVPAAQFCMCAAPASAYCLLYHFTFRDDPDPTRRALAAEALTLAHRMVYRNLPMWLADNNPDDSLDSSFLCEPNSGISWLGAACANEVWWVVYAAAQTYVHTGDPYLAQYVYGMIERWHELYRDEYYPSVDEYDGAFAERLGLYDGAEQAPGTRSSFGALWGDFEQLAWPVETATTRVVCGERGALIFTRDGRHTRLGEYRYRDGRLAVRLEPAAGVDPARSFDAVITVPLFDLRGKSVERVLEGRALALDDSAVQRYPQRPDSLLVRGVRYGETIAVGGWSPDLPTVDCQPIKPRLTAQDRSVAWPADFVAVPLAEPANRTPGFDWRDHGSLAGWEPGRKVLFGVPFELLDPVYTGGRLGVRDATAPVDAAGSVLFALVGERSPDERLTIAWDDGATTEADLASAFPALRGWPPCFEWTAEWVQVPLDGRRVRSIEPTGLTLLAATVATAPAERLARVFEVTEAERAAARAATAAVAELRQLEPVLAALDGHIAVLPGPKGSQPRSSRMALLLHRAGLLKHLEFLTPTQLVDGGTFNAERFWLTLYLGGEPYLQTVRRPRDGDDALRAYLRGGGTLLALASQPYPFYYDQDQKPIQNAAAFGLPLSVPWEKPPAGHEWSFRRNPDQPILTTLPDRLPYPAGDPRFRPIAPPKDVDAEYIPLLTLVDERDEPAGDGAAWIRYRSGDLAGGTVGYAWSTLLSDPAAGTPLLTALLRWAAEQAQPGFATTIATRSWSPVTVDGRLDEPIWSQARPCPLAYTFPTRGAPRQPTTAQLAWDEENLYVAFRVSDSDAWALERDRDGNLWEDEVVEIYIDPEGDGRDYKEFEVNPRGTVIDLNIADPARLADVDTFRRWNAAGWRTAVVVDGDPTVRGENDRAWTVEMAIPFADLGVTPKPGDAWRVQLYRIDRPREGEPEFSAWSATDTFHNPSRFGRLRFGGNPYDERFSFYPEGSDGAPTWTVEAGEWVVRDGRMTGIDSGGDAWWPVGLRTDAVEADDFELTLRFRLAERGSDHRDGLWIAFRDDGRGNGYALELGGGAAVLHKSTGGRTSNDDLYLARAAFAPDEGWHTLVIGARGAQFMVTIDGRELLAATDDGFLGTPPVRSGGIVLSARRWTKARGHTRAELESLQVTPRR